MSGQNWVKRGTLKGTGALITITCGFKPVKVSVFNVVGLAKAEKTENMGDDRAYKTITDGTASYPTDLIAMTDNGFTIGTDSDLNVADEDLHWVAHQAQND